MGNETIINAVCDSTVINSELSQKTVINADIINNTFFIPTGTILCNKYVVVNLLSASSGEAELI